MFVLFTDFGLTGPYTGQMKAVLARRAPTVPAVDLFADAPAFEPQLAASLLAAYAGAFPPGDVFVCVVDPGVGTARAPVVLDADGRRFVGPDNGLFAHVLRRARTVRAWRIDWRPETLSATFHGRDLFAPVAAELAQNAPPPGPPIDPAALDRPDWPHDLPRIVYVDVYGNAMTGLRPTAVPAGSTLWLGDRPLPQARTFADVPPGQPLWYINANGLVEIAVNQGSAAAALSLGVGNPVRIGAA